MKVFCIKVKGDFDFDLRLMALMSYIDNIGFVTINDFYEMFLFKKSFIKSLNLGGVIIYVNRDELEDIWTLELVTISEQIAQEFANSIKGQVIYSTNLEVDGLYLKELSHDEYQEYLNKLYMADISDDEQVIGQFFTVKYPDCVKYYLIYNDYVRKKYVNV